MGLGEVVWCAGECRGREERARWNGGILDKAGLVRMDRLGWVQQCFEECRDLLR